MVNVATAVQVAQKQAMKDVRKDFYNEQKPVKKSLVYKAEPLTIMEIKFPDAPNCLGVLLAKVRRRAGNSFVEVLCADGTIPDVSSEQIVRLGKLMVIDTL